MEYASRLDESNGHPKEDTHVMFDEGAKRSFRFWAIMGSLTITGLMSSLEGTITTSALPIITQALGGGNLYIWVPNAFFLSFIATLPLYAQISDIFGRRWPFIMAVALFILGSGICGGSSTMGMLIIGRTIQGIGGGGIQLLTETIITDLVPLRERGLYIALTMVAATIGAAIAPFIGGLIADKSTWRWVFYLNLPIGGGINTLPIFAGIIPFAMLGGWILSKWGRYKPLHLVGWAIITIAYGLLSMLDENSSKAAWACFQLLLAAGSGLLAGILLPAMQAPLDEGIMALAIGVWAFGRGFGSVWGVTIPSAVFNNECRLHAEKTSTTRGSSNTFPAVVRMSMPQKPF
ncbi:hypothetical protein Daesc_002570 [Daldinia eschscholtzii]|uniref:Major facilitator superfamily (MFS) profile domain-containing protein n=1 Tax=Daldinia eschscholtzii TaxID=292717 RepID=A0AAX6MRZ3_9PEZI